MATYQTSYVAAIPTGYAGMIANGETSNRISRSVADAAGIAFGVPVFRGSGAHDVTATPTAGTLSGISIANYASPPDATGLQADKYTQYSTAGVLTSGCIWVNASVAVNRGDQAYVTSAGALTNVATNNTILPNWFFEDTISAAGVARLVKRT